MLDKASIYAQDYNMDGKAMRVKVFLLLTKNKGKKIDVLCSILSSSFISKEDEKKKEDSKLKKLKWTITKLLYFIFSLFLFWKIIFIMGTQGHNIHEPNKHLSLSLAFLSFFIKLM